MAAKRYDHSKPINGEENTRATTKLETAKAEAGHEGGVAIVVDTETCGRAALMVDAITDQRQFVIKSLDTHYRSVDGVAAIRAEVDYFNDILALPNELTVRVHSCGEANAYYHGYDRSISICTELAQQVLELGQQPSQIQPATLSKKYLSWVTAITVPLY